MEKGGKINLYEEMFYPNYSKNNKFIYDANNIDPSDYYNDINPKINYDIFRTQRYLHSNLIYPSETNYNIKYNDYFYPINEKLYSSYPINNNYDNYIDEINFYKRQIDRLTQREKYRRLINTILNKQKNNKLNNSNNKEQTKEIKNSINSNRNKMRNSEIFNFNTNTNETDYYKNLGMKLKISNYQTKTGTIYANRTNFFKNLYKNNLNFDDDKKNYKLNRENTYNVINKTDYEDNIYDDYNTDITRNKKKLKSYFKEKYYNNEDDFENENYYDTNNNINLLVNDESINNSYLNKYDNLVNDTLQNKKMRNEIGKNIQKEYEEQEIQIIKIHHFIMHLEIVLVLSIKKNFEFLINNMKYYIEQKIKRTHELLKRFDTKKKPNHYIKINNQNSNQLNSSCKKTTIYSTSNKKNKTIGYFKENKAIINDNNLNETTLYVPKKNVVQSSKKSNKFISKYSAYNKCIKKLMKNKKINNNKENTIRNTTNRRIKNRQFMLENELNNTVSREINLNNTLFNDSVINNINNQNKSCKSLKDKEIIYFKKTHKTINNYYTNKINYQNSIKSPVKPQDMLYFKKNTNTNKALTSKKTAIFIKPFAKNIPINQSIICVKKNNKIQKNISFGNLSNDNGKDNSMTQNINFKLPVFILRSPTRKKITNKNYNTCNDINKYDNDIRVKPNKTTIKNIQTYDKRLTITIKYVNLTDDKISVNKKKIKKKLLNCNSNKKKYLKYNYNVLKIIHTDNIQYLHSLNKVQTVVLLDIDSFDDKSDEIGTFRNSYMNNLNGDKKCSSIKNISNNNDKVLQTNKVNKLKININDNNNLINKKDINNVELLNKYNEKEKKFTFNIANISKLIKTISRLIYKYFLNQLSKINNSSKRKTSKKTPIFSTLTKLNQEKFNKYDDKSFSSNNITSQKSLPEFTDLQSISSEKSISSKEMLSQKLDKAAEIKTNSFMQQTNSLKNNNDDVKFKKKLIGNLTNISNYSEINKKNNMGIPNKNNINSKKVFNKQIKKNKIIKKGKKHLKNKSKDYENKIRKRDIIKYLIQKKIIKSYFNKWKSIKNNKAKKSNKKMKPFALSSNTIINAKKINDELYQDVKEKTKMFRLILINFALNDNKNLESISDDFD